MTKFDFGFSHTGNATNTSKLCNANLIQSLSMINLNTLLPLILRLNRKLCNKVSRKNKIMSMPFQCYCISSLRVFSKS